MCLHHCFDVDTAVIALQELFCCLLMHVNYYFFPRRREMFEFEIIFMWGLAPLKTK